MTVGIDEDVGDLLPEHMQDSWFELVSRTIEADEPLTVGLVGPFSVGKSSLLNTLLERDILPVGQTETTAIPTFIESGEEWGFQHATGPDEAESITEDAFRDLAEESASEGEFATVTAPRDWLEGYQLVDLPGLGTVDDDRRALTRAQISSVDVLLYMLDSRGPTREDIEHLTHAHNHGKHIQVLAGKWDRVLEAAEQRDEPMVDLSEWNETLSEQIEASFDIKPVSIEGHGREELIEYLSELREELDEIRQNQFEAEASKLVRHAVSELEDEKSVLTADTDEEMERLRDELQEQRSELLEMKSDAYERRQESREQMNSSFESAKEETLKRFDTKVGALQTTLLEKPEQSEWAHFVDEANQQAETILGSFTSRIEKIHGDSLDTEELETEWSNVELQFPSPPKLDRDEWLDSGRREKLREQIEVLAAETEEEEEAAATQDEPDNPERRQALRQRLQDLRRQRQEVADADLPEVQIEEEGDKTGSTIGRYLGEVGDIALMFGAPATIGSKIASWLGKGGKALNLGSKGMKAVDKVQKGVQKAGKWADKAAKIKKTAEAGESLGKEGKLARAFGLLEKFSVSYWTEKVGSWFDSPPSVDFQVDPEAVEQQQEAIDELGREIQQIHKELEQVDAAKSSDGLTEYEQKLKQRKYDRLQKQLEEQQREEKRKKAELEEERERILRDRIDRESKRLTQQLRYQLVQQIRGMEKQLNQSFKSYWEEKLEETFAAKESHLEDLERRMDEKPDEVDQKIAAIDEKIGELKATAERWT